MSAFTDDQLEAAIDDLGIAQFCEKLRDRISTKRLHHEKPCLRIYLDAARVIATHVAGPALIVGVGAMLWVAL